METIYKYKLEITDLQLIEVTGFIKVLKVDEQNGGLYIWCLINTEDKLPEKVDIRIFGTGHNILVSPSIRKETYIDTVIMSNGLVWHVFIQE